ncbi:Bifunctional cytochrome P450/NADPH--P450 reductase [Streptomyces sp. RB5]|uniref:Bifunctional cytochrome P450/NADPH--P450 reductase n=1 Tax=Streptomyces smaragdinus TaxID=2585196 RepID=A0A7K0CCH4_9ACTN|nr:cytochrome P450 [Streptomyces smaragdinus]MQY10454.1 Bifunctional cytochrome P450/NADPH--P450 reductase [Streptomyces smaragdinus]
MQTQAIPHPPYRLPLLGDILGARPSRPVQTSIALSRRLGPIFVRKFLYREILLVAGAELAADLSDETRFAKHVGLGVDNLRRLAGDGLFTAYNSEPNWQLAHDILLPAFARGAMESYHPVMLDVARELIADWDAKADGPPVDVAADMTKLTLETIGRTGFGYSFQSFERERPHPFVAAMVAALRHAQLRSFRFPVISRLLGARRADRRNDVQLAYMSDLVDEVIRTRRESGAGGDDLLGRMLNEPHPETGEKLSDLNIRNQVITFLVAGHETTSGALSFALYYLSRNPGALEKARAEVDAAWGQESDPKPAYGEVAKLRYVRRVLDESLRLWPTAPAYARVAREDTMLGGRYPMSAGDWAFVLIPGVHRDPAVWGPDAESFDPDRFAPGRVRERPAHSYKPFGTGERACIGRQFAIHEATLVLALLLHRYELIPDPAYELRVTELLTVKPEGFTLRLRRRTAAAPRPAAGPPARPERDEEPACPYAGGVSGR